MSRSNFKQTALALLLAAAMASAHADSVGARVPALPAYQQECAACHIAYPPGLLPAASWQRMMGSLKQHFGTDASLDEASVREISGWLQANAATYKRVGEAPPQDRITKSAWFLREHNEREVPAAVWKRAAIGSASNCAACHSQAAQGSFSEREIKIPR
jgi:mono/diheme cytochrome c family protein